MDGRLVEERGRPDQSGARRPDERADGESPVEVLDTLELRWFASGPVPPDVLEWFVGPTEVAASERRSDSYLEDGLDERGVKLRSGRTLEVKLRLDILEPVGLGPGLEGATELWRKWSPAEHLIDVTEDSEWTEVSKSIVKRRFTPTGAETQPSKQFPASGGCDVEIAAVGIGDADAWSFALAAFGPAETRRETLLASWQALVDRSEPPEGFASALTDCCGYGEWLAARWTERRS